jgi:hypothetical protein
VSSHIIAWHCSVLMEHFEELLPIVSIPTVREACQKYGLMFKSLPRGLFVTLEDRGRVFRCGDCAVAVGYCVLCALSQFAVVRHCA